MENFNKNNLLNQMDIEYCRKKAVEMKRVFNASFSLGEYCGEKFA